jgi:hypothetical protein
MNPEKAKEMSPPGKGNEEQVSKEGAAQETDRRKKIQAAAETERPGGRRSGTPERQEITGKSAPASRAKVARSIKNDR